jgi:hypothetical protein
MTNITKVLSLSLLLSIGACGGGPSVADFEKLKTEACACKDKACADAVDKKIDAALDKMKEPNEADGKKIMSLMADAAVCIGTLGGGN